MCYCYDGTFTEPMVKLETKDPLDEPSRPSCMEAAASAGMKRKQPEDVEAEPRGASVEEDNPVIVHKKFRKSQSRWPGGTGGHQKDLTLEQFTDIVLASEGIRAKAGANPEGEHRAMVANIMSNKDLTVEVKPAPLSVKPVVLSPRYPNG